MGVDLRPRIRVELVLGDEVVVDEILGLALLAIGEGGSILSASRALGVAYSRLWERIARAERILGGPLVESKRGGRGGGGARLTPLGRRVAEAFARAYERVHGVPPRIPVATRASREALVYAGSNDPLLQRILGELSDAGVRVEAYWLGSLRGVASVILGDADVAGLHIADPDTGEYNTPIVRGAVSAGHMALLRGYQRRIGLVSRRPLRLSEVLEGLLSGGLSLVNRPPGSGARILLERLLLERLDGASGLGVLEGRVKGWNREVATHLEVAEAVARGEADVGVAVEPAARVYGLYFIPVAWEWFDFLLSTWPPRGALRAFVDMLCSKRLSQLAGELSGYRVTGELCRRIL